MVAAQAEYRRSSAAVHLHGEADRGGVLDLDFFARSGGTQTWREWHEANEDAAQTYLLRRCTYAGRPFVQMLASGETPDTAHTVGTNRIDISAVHDPRTGNFILTSAEDNLVKGASGQAVQIMNLWCGFEETCGLV